MIKILHIITGLSPGGAEMMLYKLLASMNRSRFESAVISLMTREGLGKEIEALGIPVYKLGMMAGRPSPSAVFRLRRLINLLDPDLIQGWMYHGNITALVARTFMKKNPPVLWNVRQTLYRIEDEKWLTQQVIRVCRYFSNRVSRIIYNSSVSASQHEAFGFSSNRRIVLFNGFDVQLFRPSDSDRNTIRKSLGLANDLPVVGLFARYHPMKDHANFINAANIVHSRMPDVHFLLVGRNVSQANQKLMVGLSDARENFHLLGERNDIPALMASIDVGVTSSGWGEGFPNVIGEAMACGVPCVVTDVGDSAWIVGEGNGRVVPPGDSSVLAAAIIDLLQMGKEKRSALGMSGRQRVVEEFSIEKIADQYHVLYDQVYLESCNTKN